MKFKHQVLIVALMLAGCAGWFSISGISQLFIGAPIAAAIMAFAIECGKVTSISVLYRMWDGPNRMFKSYLFCAILTTSTITSIGVYGYLSAAYAKAATGVMAVQNDVSLIGTQQKSITASIKRLEARQKTIENVRSQQENRLDKLVGKKGLADQQGVIRQADKQLSDIEAQISDLSHKQDSLEVKKIEIQNNLSTNSKIGTFWYIAKSLGVELDSIVHWFILAIVLVFDPLSVTLIIAYNMIKDENETQFTKQIPEQSSEEIPTATQLAAELEQEANLAISPAQHRELVTHPPVEPIKVPHYSDLLSGGIDTSLLP